MCIPSGSHTGAVYGGIANVDGGNVGGGLVGDFPHPAAARPSTNKHTRVQCRSIHITNDLIDI
jgi:hypothetical protein